MLQIRPVSPADEAACLSLDPSFVTDHVWQMEHKLSASDVQVHFRTVHLPRLVKLTAPWPVESAFRHRRSEDFFILTEEDLQLRGYLYLRNEVAHSLCWVDHLAVAGPLRRQGRGTSLLEEGRRWARSRGLRGVIVAIQARNYPAIRFFQKSGFRYSGYNDHYFPRDVAVFFQAEL
ncbi:MAG TPA: GNAT family N-acetyltransferase [Dehalococcoidia bacterium]|nr:GNAT family N-acetyltransferase [Dehalococcoidia bacterium]